MVPFYERSDYYDRLVTHCFFRLEPMQRLLKQSIAFKLLAGVVTSILVSVPTFAQEPSTQQSSEQVAPSRPRVGLVLSGGGARGAAHVGVLKVLEEMRIPIDAIAGTSMGAIVGGLYASGMSAKDIEKLLLSLDWQDAFSDRLPRRDLGFRRKQDDRNFLVRYALGVSSKGFKLPQGLIQGQKLSQVLRDATLPVAGIYDFDRFPVPFRAVATDLVSGEEVVMSHGDLTTAMRASMSAPAVFVPMERDGRLLVDGGLTQNLPVEIARRMGVDVLIVVDVSFPLRSREQLRTPVDVTFQASTIMMRQRIDEQRALLTERDILIDPELGSFSSSDFAHVGSARDLGEAAARQAQTRLAELSLDTESYQRYAATRNPRIGPPPVVSFVRTDANSKRYEPQVQYLLADAVGKPLNKAEIETLIATLYGEDLFESVDYTLVEDAGASGLEFHLKRKAWGPNYVRFGLNIEDDFLGNSRYNVGARFIATELNTYGGEWLTDVQIGDHPRLYSEFYQPLGHRHRYFVSPHFGFDVRNFEVEDQYQRLSEYRIRDNKTGLDVGRELGNWGEWRTGVFRGTGSARVRIGDTSLPQSSFSSGGYFARLTYDTLDNIFYPRHGWQWQADWIGQRTTVGSDRTSDRLEVKTLVAQSYRKHTLILSAAVGSTLNSQNYAQDYFQLGGFLNLSGLHAGQLSGSHYGLARAIYYRKVGNGGEGTFDVPLYAGISLEAGNTWLKRSDMRFGDLRENGSIFMGADTILGPVFLGAGADAQGNSAFYLFLGRTF
jgi:NTE family protein